MDRIFAKLCYELEKKHDTVLVAIISRQGSAPRGAGSLMLVGAEGHILGSIGGGAVEKRSELMALDLLKRKTSLCHFFQLHERAKEDIGMICGGDVNVLFQYIPGESADWAALAGAILERIKSRAPGWLSLKTDGSFPSLLDSDGNALLGEAVPGIFGNGSWLPQQSAEVFNLALPVGERAYIFGGGHCAQALAPVLQSVGFRVTVFDEREEFANRARFPAAEHVILGKYTRLADSLTITAEDYVVIMTNGHVHDLDVEDQVLRGPFAYVGVIGSSRKTASVNEKLRARGVSEAAIAQVHTPIGTVIKAVTPEEIAISIAGEMIYERALRREKAGIITHSCPMH